MIITPGILFTAGLSFEYQIGNPYAIFGYGTSDGSTGLTTTNLVSNTGVVASDVSNSGSTTARFYLAAAGYGTDKAIFGFGKTGSASSTGISLTSYITNTGVVTGDVTNASVTGRYQLAAAGYSKDKAIFGFGFAVISPSFPYVSTTNLVSNTGTLATDTTGVGTARADLAAARYGTDKAIFGYGIASASPFYASMTNLVSNTGVVATDTTGVGTARNYLAAAGYGTDKAIFGYGSTGTITAITNLVSNTGVVATDTAGVGTARYSLAAAGYGVDKAIFGFGIVTFNPGVSTTNLVSNTGVVGNDVTGVGTSRYRLSAASYGSN
jgi:hypothetical protein